MYNAFFVFMTAGHIIFHEVPGQYSGDEPALGAYTSGLGLVPPGPYSSERGRAAAAHIIFHEVPGQYAGDLAPPGPYTSESDLTSQSWWAVWCLGGLPLIITSLWAASSKYDIVLRIYMAYLAATLIMDSFYFWYFILEHDACHRLPPNLQFHGFSFACGFTRFFVFGFATILSLIEAYLVLLVWSYCDEMTDHGADNLVFADLQAGAKQALCRQSKEHFGGILGYSDYSTLYGKRKEPVQVCIGPSYGIQDLDYLPKYW
jgi:hypothetical protein